MRDITARLPQFLRAVNTSCIISRFSAICLCTGYSGHVQIVSPVTRFLTSERLWPLGRGATNQGLIHVITSFGNTSGLSIPPGLWALAIAYLVVDTRPLTLHSCARRVSAPTCPGVAFLASALPCSPARVSIPSQVRLSLTHRRLAQTALRRTSSFPADTLAWACLVRFRWAVLNTHRIGTLLHPVGQLLASLDPKSKHCMLTLGSIALSEGNG